MAVNLAATLAKQGRRVLLIDLDPQAHCALGMAVPDEQIDLSILDCLMGGIEGEPVELSRITWQIAPHLDLAPSRASLAALEPRLGTREDAESLLRDLLQANSGRYDYCVLDCPPHFGLLMRNGMRAADEIIVPVDTGYFALHGLTQQLASIDQLGERWGRKPKVRILPNQYDVRTKLAREILAELKTRFKGLVFDTVMNFNTKLKEGVSFGQPITEFAPTSMGARDFQRLAQEVVSGHQGATVTNEIIKHAEKLAADAERLLATTTVLVDNGRRDAAMRDVSRREPAGAGPVSPAINPFGPGESQPFAPPVIAPGLLRRTPSSEPAVRIWSSDKAAASSSSTGAPAQPPARPVTPPAKPVTPPVPTLHQRENRAAAAEPRRPSTHEEIDRKLERIYGVRQEGEVVIFRSHHPEASEIQLAGDFNDWMPHTTPMQRLSNGDFECRLRLPKGRYRYRLVVDGRWLHDLHNPRMETNEYGELNSVVEIQR